jgi:hypothetical protein
LKERKNQLPQPLNAIYNAVADIRAITVLTVLFFSDKLKIYTYSSS